MRRGTGRGKARSTGVQWRSVIQKETGNSVHRQSPIGADRLTEETVGGEDGSFIGNWNNSQQMSHGSVPKHFEYELKFGSKNRQEWHSHGGIQEIGADRLTEETVGGEDGSFIGNWNNSQQMSHGSVPKHFEYKLKFGSKNRQEWHSHGGIQEVGADRLAEETVGGEDGSSMGKRNNSQQMSQGSVPKNSEYKPKLGSKSWQEWHSHGGKDGFANIARSQQEINSPESVGSRSKQFKCMRTPDSAHKQDFPQLSGWSDSEDLDAGRFLSGKILSVGTADSITLQDDLPNQAGPTDKGASLEVNMEFKLKVFVQVETQVLSEYKPKLGSKKWQEWHSRDDKDGFANIVRSQQGINSPESVGSRSKQFKCMGNPDSAHKQDFPQLSGRSDSEDLDAGRIRSGKILSVGTADSITLQDDLPHQAAPSNEGASLEVDMESKLKRISIHQVETQLLSLSAKKIEPSSSKDPKSSAGHKNLEHFQHSAMLDSVDLCPTKSEKTVGADRLAEVTVGGEDGSSIGKRNNLQQMSQGSVLKNSKNKPKLGSKNRQEWHSHCGKDGFSNIVRSQQGINSPESVGSRSKQSKCMGTPDSSHKQDFSQLSGQSNSEDLDAGRIRSEKILSVGTADSITLQDDLPHQAAPSNEGASLEVDMQSKLKKISVHQVETQLRSVSAKKFEPSSNKDPKSSAGDKNLEHSEHSAMLDSSDLCPTKSDSFDLCPTKFEKTVTLKPPLLLQNRERRNEIKSSLEGQNGIVLRAGMVLLKSYISFSDQVKIVKKCRDLGLGPGGFYQPGYRNGAKLRLKMMCLGKNWDPETGNYGDHRPVDEAKPPTIPAEFYQLVKKSIEDSHSLIQENSKSSNVESILPWMSPNICRVNYYSENGRLGLHQDRNESQESLAKGLPVVSFSIGDKADFLYGDQRDVDKAEKVVLESGDVLIFGGKSRHIFHGVTAIHPNSAPKSLLEETKLRPGRLNLTFRQY